MSVEELLRPRYKVIADYFFNPYKIGAVINSDEACRVCLTITTQYSQFTAQNEPVHNFGHIDTLNEYPHLFKKLEWWEERKPEELPQYIVWDYKPRIDNSEMKGYCQKVEGWAQGNYGVIIKGGTSASKNWLPTTEREYNNYITTPTR